MIFHLFYKRCLTRIISCCIFDRFWAGTMIIDQTAYRIPSNYSTTFPAQIDQFSSKWIWKRKKNPASIYFFKGKRRKKTFTEHSVGKKSTSASNGVFLVSPRINLYFTPSESVGEKVNRLITVWNKYQVPYLHVHY